METFLFNPQPHIRAFGLKTGGVCWVIDDVLLNPEHMLEFALENRAKFQQAPFNAYPGMEFPMPDIINEKLNTFFILHMRRYFNTRRVVDMHSRMAMVTLAPEALQARQWICHRDSAWVDPQHAIIASVLYLFKDENLGGTQFFAPTKPMPEIERLVHDASTMSNDGFSAKYGIYPGYYTGSDDNFELIGNIPAKFNRMIFYDGRIFHTGDIRATHAMSADPSQGRLTLNGFFTCTRKSM
jgi:hypothetical protein